MNIKHAITLRHSGIGLIALALTTAATFAVWGVAIGHGGEALATATFAAAPIALGITMICFGSRRVA